jgi:hypothetical protein
MRPTARHLEIATSILKLLAEDFGGYAGGALDALLVLHIAIVEVITRNAPLPQWDDLAEQVAAATRAQVDRIKRKRERPDREEPSAGATRH